MAEKLILAAAAGCCFFLGFESGGYQYVLARAALEFKVNALGMGAFVTIQFLASMISPALCGGLADRFGKRRIFGGFMGVFFLGCLMVYLSAGAPAFAWGIFVTGFGYSMCESLAAVVAANTGKENQNGAVNLVQAAFSLGAVAGPWAADVMISVWAVGWRFLFLAAGMGCAGMIALLAIGGRRQGAAKLQAKECRGYNQKQSQLPAAASAVSGERRRFDRCLWVLAALMMGYAMIETGGIYFIDTLRGSLGGESRISAYGISAVWMSMTVSRLAASRIRIKRLPVIAGGFFMAAAAVYGISLCGSAQQMAAACLLLGAALGPLWPALMSSTIERFQEKAALAASRMVMAGSAGGAVMPLIMGAVTDACGVRAAYWMASAVGIAACGIICFWGLKNGMQIEKGEDNDHGF